MPISKNAALAIAVPLLILKSIINMRFLFLATTTQREIAV